MKNSLECKEIIAGKSRHRMEIRQESLVDELLRGRRYGASAIQHGSNWQNVREDHQVREERAANQIFDCTYFRHVTASKIVIVIV